MENSESHYVFDPLYLLSERYRKLTSVPEDQRDEKEIFKIKKILQREDPSYLYAEGENIITI